MKNQIIASITAIPFAFAGVFANANLANAAALTGSFHFDGADDPATTVNFSKDMLDFKPEGNSQVDLKLQKESFEDFDSAYIFDVNFNSVDSQLFMDFGDKDGKNLLFLTQLSDYEYDYDGFTTGVTVEFQGFFESVTGKTSDAKGRLTFQALGEVTKSDINKSKSFEASFSSVTVATETERVPEPTTLFGLGVVAAGLTVSRRQSKKGS